MSPFWRCMLFFLLISPISPSFPVSPYSPYPTFLFFLPQVSDEKQQLSLKAQKASELLDIEESLAARAE